MAIELFTEDMSGEVIKLWNRSIGDDFPLSERLFKQNIFTDPDPKRLRGLVAKEGDRIVGFILAKGCLKEAGEREDQGWISIMLIDPEHTGEGIGTELYSQAEGFLRERGARRLSLGGDFFHFFPGVPTKFTSAMDFFEKQGYERGAEAYDLARSLVDYETPAYVYEAIKDKVDLTIRNCREDEKEALLDFLAGAFPGRWYYGSKLFLERGTAASDFLIALEKEKIIGFCHIYHPGSKMIIGPNVYWSKLLGENYGGLGPMGLDAEKRGKGIGLALLARSVEYLRSLGVEKMAIDWTGLLYFYGKLGFEVWKEYTHMYKILE